MKSFMVDVIAMLVTNSNRTGSQITYLRNIPKTMDGITVRYILTLLSLFLSRYFKRILSAIWKLEYLGKNYL
jgi:hypothetical protein